MCPYRRFCLPLGFLSRSYQIHLHLLLQGAFYVGIILAHHPRIRSFVHCNSLCIANPTARIAACLVWQLSDTGKTEFSDIATSAF